MSILFTQCMINMMTPALEFINGTMVHTICTILSPSITKIESFIGNNIIFVNNCCAYSIINSPSLTEPQDVRCPVVYARLVA